MRSLASLVALAGSLAGLTFAGQPRADEPRKVTEPRVLREPSEIVQVVDAFDDDDVFDLHLSLGYQHTWKNAKILPRDHDAARRASATGGYTVSNMNVAEYEESTARLNTRADIGIYKDIASDSAADHPFERSRAQRARGQREPCRRIVLAGAPGEQLFRLPFKSPTRSGIEYLAVGIDFGHHESGARHDEADLGHRRRGALQRLRADARLQREPRPR